MSRINSTRVKWRVQVRKSRAHKWVNKGLFETRAGARLVAEICRDFSTVNSAGSWRVPYGFGNTRVIRHVAALKGKKPVVYGDCLIRKGGNAELRRGDGTGDSRVLKTWRDGKLVRTKP